jgi:beta-glucosidase
MDTPITLGHRPEDFIWASGIENSFVPQTRRGHRALDEYQLIGHYDHWREDLALAKELGVRTIRWGVPWYRVEPLPGEFDWRWTDQVLPYIVEELGITPIIDLMHYGCPFWLERAFTNGQYPRAVASYAAAFATRYKHLVKWYTPCNEPLMTADLCGKAGAWPPYLRGERGYVRVMLPVVKGIIATIDAIKEVDPDAKMVHVEAVGISRASHPTLDHVAEHNTNRFFLAYDLLTRKVTPDHPLYAWLLNHGARPRELAEISARHAPIDVMGINFYPQWSTHELFFNEHGHVAARAAEMDGVGFKDMIKNFYTRYGLPIMVTETSARDSHEERSNWLNNSLAAVKQLRAEGVPVLGYTWFPLFTMIDWRYRWERGPMENYLLDLGLYQLHTNGNANNNGNGNSTRWRATPLLEEIRAKIANPAESIGHLAVG